MSVSRAFVEHGAAFSRWLDAQEGGMAAEALVEVSFDAAGLPSFSADPEQHPAAQQPHEPAEQEVTAVA